MIVNFPFVPEPEGSVEKWLKRAVEIDLKPEMIDRLNLRTLNRYIPNNLTRDITGFDDNTGLYSGRLDNDYQRVKMEDGYSILAYRFGIHIPVVAKEFRKKDEYSDEKAEHCEEPLYKSYGYVLSFDHFMEIIGKQLKKSKRKFCVSFSGRKFHDSIFDRSGRLYHPDHTKLDLKENDKIYHFNIFELIEDGKDFIIEDHEDTLAFQSNLFFATDSEHYFEMTDNFRIQSHVESEIKRYHHEVSLNNPEQ